MLRQLTWLRGNSIRARDGEPGKVDAALFDDQPRSTRHLAVNMTGRAMSVGTATNWSGNLIVALSFLTLTHLLGKSATFWLYGVVSIGAWIFTYYMVPETKGKSLEQIEAHWKSGKPACVMKMRRGTFAREITMRRMATGGLVVSPQVPILGWARRV